MHFDTLYGTTGSHDMAEALPPVLRSQRQRARPARMLVRMLGLAHRAVPLAMLPVLLGMGSHAMAASNRTISVAVGEGQLIRLGQPAATVFVANPEIADVQVPDGTAIFVLGKRSGTTSVFALGDESQPLLERRVVVRHNTAEMLETLRQRFPQLRLSLESAPGSLMVRGTANSAEEVDAVANTLRPYLGENETLINRLTLASPTQVMLRVRVTEVSRAVTQRLGINWSAIAAPGNFVTGIISGRTFQNIENSFTQGDNRGRFRSGGGYSGAADGFSFLGGYSSGNTSVQAMIDALDREGLISVLAEPNLTAVSGQTASFLAGGEFPIPVRQEENSMTVEFKSFGVALDFTPTVLADDRISIQVRPEISEIDVANSVTMEGLSIPGISVRRVETTVEMASGESFAIGGLLQNNVRDLVSQVPGLGSLPVLGRLFSSSDYQTNKTELVVIVTPYLVKPAGAGQLRSPLDSMRPSSDIEYLLQQRIGLDPISDETPRLTGAAGFNY